MSKKLLLLVLFGLFAAMVFAASIANVHAGLHSNNHDPRFARPGDTITVTYSFIPSGFDEIFGSVQGSKLGVSTYDKIRIQWYSNADGTGNTSYLDVETTQFDDPSVRNDIVNYNTLSFVLPAIPPNRRSFKIRSVLYGDDGFFNEVISDYILSSGVGEDTFAFLPLDTNTAPTATVQITNPQQSKVGQTLNGSYTYYDADGDPEGATQLAWLRSTSSDPNGLYARIVGAAGTSYTVVNDDLNRFIKFQVTPVAITGVTQGSPTNSAASSQVLPAAAIALDPTTRELIESATNDGSVAGYVIVALSNGSFQPTVSTVTINNLPAGLTVGNIVRISNSQIRVSLSGAALEHEHASSILDDFTLFVTVPANQIVGQTDDLQTATGFRIDFANNPVSNFACSSVGDGKVTLSWNRPSGLAGSTALANFKVYRNGNYINQIVYSSSQASYSYTDSGLTNGTSYLYYILADYDNPGVSEDPSSINIAATPMLMSSFSFAALGVSGTIDQDAKSVSLTVPVSTNLTALVASFTVSPSISARVNGNLQTSGVTANNFSNPVQYVLSALDGTSSSYTVTVSFQGDVLSAPVLTSGLPTTSSVQILWNPVSEAVGYSLDLSTDSLFGSFIPGYQSLELPASPETFVINGLAANTQYYARLRALSPNPSSHSSFSEALNAQTLATGNGTGSTEIKSSDATPVNIGQYYDASWDYTINPALTIDPQSFNPQSNNVVEASISVGTSPEGLRYLLDFDNPSIGIGTFTMSYDGLPYDPTDLGFRINDGRIIPLGSMGINTLNKTFTISLNALSKNQKGTYRLELITNDATGQTLPVMLSNFSAIVLTGSNVRISWTTQAESGVQGFYVLRGISNELSAAETISPLIEATNTSATTNYTFTDSELPGLGEYYYWLQIQDITGSTSYSNSIQVKIETEEEPIPEVIKSTSLKNAYPNPFNPLISISYDIVVAGHVSMEVYNTRGQKIRTLVSENKEPAAYTVTWDGKDASGREVSSGPYLVKMKAKEYEATRKITLLK
jgi:hypothetical protein